MQLRLPSQQTAAVTRAKKQGRSLIEPLGDEPRSKRKDREGRRTDSLCVNEKLSR